MQRLLLERISKLSKQDADAAEADEAEEVLCVVLPAGDETPVVLQPGKQPLDRQYKLAPTYRPYIILLDTSRNMRKAASSQTPEIRPVLG